MSGKIRSGLILTAWALMCARAWAASWTQQALLTASDAAAKDFFGTAVSISGDYALVGAGLDDDLGDWSGSAYVFHRTGTAWIQQAKLTAADGAANELFAYGSVSLSGDYALIGAHYDDASGPQSGSAYVFARSGTSWVQQAKLVPSDGAAYDFFGTSLCISGDYALVGAHSDDLSKGSAYIFHRVGSTWTQQAKLTAAVRQQGAAFGASVCLDGDYALIGASRDSSSGAAYVFRRSGSAWTQIAKLTPSDGASHDWFGVSMSLRGNLALIAARGDDDRGSDSGSAYVFTRTGSAWAETAKLTASDGAPNDNFGVGVAIDGDDALVSSHRGDYSAWIYHFHWNGSAWAEVGRINAPPGAEHTSFGYEIAMDGGTAILSAVGTDLPGADNAGAAYILTPEPGTLALLALGGPAMLRRRQRR